jgi:Tfp pilus assembly protein PilN
MMSPRWMQHLSRADFLKSVGLYVMRDHIVLVRMRKNFLRLSLIEQEVRELSLGESFQSVSDLTGWVAEEVREVALKAEAESRQRAMKEAIHSLLPHFNPGKDSLYVCVPQDQAVVQQLLLPQAAEENLQQVLDYELERHLPFRREDIYYDFLPLGKRGDKIAVFLFAVPKKSLAGILEVLDAFGIQPNGVETTATALANCLLFCAGDLAGPAAVVGGQNRSWEIVGLQTKPNGWSQQPELLFSHWLPESDWAQGAGRELLQTCLSRAPKLFGWGNVGDILRSPEGEPLQYEDLMARGNERLKLGQGIAHPYVLPAVGAALRGLREASFGVNFLRGERADEERGSIFSGVNAGLMALLLLGTLAWGASYPIKDELRLRQLQKENQKLEPSVEALRREESELQKLGKEVSFLSDLNARRGEVLRVMDELSRTVPTNAYLSNFRYRGGVLELQGSAESASNLVPLLERSPVFESVTFNAPSNRGRDNRETFSLKAEIERRKERPTKR